MLLKVFEVSKNRLLSMGAGTLVETEALAQPCGSGAWKQAALRAVCSPPAFGPSSCCCLCPALHHPLCPTKPRTALPLGSQDSLCMQCKWGHSPLQHQAEWLGSSSQ